jgi:tRNA threonylcarbamoyladenosine biosynthesis protein TsaB
MITVERNHEQKDHGSFLQLAIRRACKSAAVELSSIDAIAVANGPGSYTGLRVGLASAKGICYALHKPLILLSTLDILASALKENAPNDSPGVLFCPLIDARRLEVYTALYDVHLNLIKEPAAMILSADFLKDERDNYQIVVAGNGSAKLRSILQHENIIYSPVEAEMRHFVRLAHHAYGLKKFADVAYSEPVYLKPVYIKQR